jgi:hypothetical protein
VAELESRDTSGYGSTNPLNEVFSFVSHQIETFNAAVRAAAVNYQTEMIGFSSDHK